MIIISGYRSQIKQPFLFPEQLGNHGHIRCVIGALAEQMTAQLTGGRIHKTDSTANYCPDISVNGCYYESKATGRSRQTFIYAGRLERDRKFVEAGYSLNYVIWHHTAMTKMVHTVPELESLILQSLRAVWVVPFREINNICSSLLPEKLNSKYGGIDRTTYGTGYRIRLSSLPIMYITQQWSKGVTDVTDIRPISRN